MIQIASLGDDVAQAVVDDGEFPDSIIDARFVAIVMTQSWCPDWLWMRSWLRQMARSGKPATKDILVHVLVYNQVDSFHDFMRHKEQTFGNQLIPYVRYFVDGVYRGDSNRLGPRQFLKRFESDAQPSTGSSR